MLLQTRWGLMRAAKRGSSGERERRARFQLVLQAHGDGGGQWGTAGDGGTWWGTVGDGGGRCQCGERCHQPCAAGVEVPCPWLPSVPMPVVPNASTQAAACQIRSNQRRDGAFSPHTSSPPASTARPRSTGGEEPAPGLEGARTALPAHGPLAPLAWVLLTELFKAGRNNVRPG